MIYAHKMRGFFEKRQRYTDIRKKEDKLRNITIIIIIKPSGTKHKAKITDLSWGLEEGCPCHPPEERVEELKKKEADIQPS